ncbi:hypothetical protein DAETH_33360 (plasmid) [Deinococcus aetherius]|uniref:Uncharacterized protein n=1 Tax=Deinococcus aetherius TaxID=200252 RepID=A0ABM8AHT0_9DEIO|nr:hypothetical protein [Deinococcus aetherius]BDP43367.1 hypothetical protein DAETH_33360 [Deinococcus aetherius]
MDTNTLSARAQILGHTLRQQGRAVGEEAALEVVTRFRAGEDGQPLATLDGALREQGVALDAGALARVAWALLGVPSPRSVRLTSAARGRLTHLVELHDVSLPSRARELGGQLAREETLAPDLLRARPWLGGGQGAREVLAAVFDTEWSGFLSLLGEFGPWVYAPSVADLQTLSHGYAALVRLASGRREADVLAAALRLERDASAGSLLARLEVTDYRGDASSREVRDGTAGLVEAEEAFWAAAARQARHRRDEWAARRGEGRGPAASPHD